MDTNPNTTKEGHRWYLSDLHLYQEEFLIEIIQNLCSKQDYTYEQRLYEIFKKSNLKLVDCSEYEGKKFKVDENLEVSYRWLAKRLSR